MEKHQLHSETPVKKLKVDHDATLEEDTLNQDIESNVYKNNTKEELILPDNISRDNNRNDNVTIKQELVDDQTSSEDDDNSKHDELSQDGQKKRRKHRSYANSAVEEQYSDEEESGTTSRERSDLAEITRIPCPGTFRDQVGCDDTSADGDQYEDSGSSCSDEMLPDDYLNNFVIPIMDDESSESMPSNQSDRSKDDCNWTRAKAKQACNRGEKYVNARGKERAARIMGKGCENCRAKCHLRVTEDQRRDIFQQFWNLGNHALQWHFIAMHTRTKETERKTTNWHSNRKISRTYHFDIDDEEVKVCRVMFLSTLGISESWIKTASLKKSPSLYPDGRGKTRKKFYKIKGPVLESIIEHINLFDRCEDCRDVSKKECLPENLSFRKMYEFYCEFMSTKQQQLDDEAARLNKQRIVLGIATERQYRDVFKGEYKITFHPPRKGQCEFCAAWKSSSAAKKSQIEQEYEEHVNNKDVIREIKDADKAEAVKKSALCMASFYSQKVHVPYGEVPAFYYTSKLNFYNFTIFDIGRSQGYCYCWHEEIAKSGSNESGSCLKDFIEQKIAIGAKDFRFYSDSCTVQNKNKFIFALWYFLAVKHGIKITHRFMENGHTLTEADAVRTAIERKLKKQPLYSPDEVINLIKVVKDSKFVVHEVKQDEVFDLTDLISDHNFTKDTEGNEVKWSDVREVYVSGDTPGIVKFRYGYTSDQQTVIVGAPESSMAVSNYVYKRAFQHKLPVTEKKRDDLIRLCTQNLIPTEKQHVYYQLTTESGRVNEDRTDK